MRLDDLLTPFRTFEARVSASAATVDSPPSRSRPRVPPSTISLWILLHPPRPARTPQKPRLPRRQSPTRLLPGAPCKGLTRSSPRARLCPSLLRLAHRRSRRRRLLPITSPLERAAVQQRKLVRDPLRSIMYSGPARPPGHFQDELQPRRKLDGRGRLRPPSRPLLFPTRRSARRHFRPTTTTQSRWELLSYSFRLLLVIRRLHLPGRMPSTTLLNCGSRIPSRDIRMPIESENSTVSRRATPHFATSISAGRCPCCPTFWRATPRTSVSASQTSGSWRVIVDYIQPTTATSYSSVTGHCHQQGLTNPTLWHELLAY